MRQGETSRLVMIYKKQKANVPLTQKEIQKKDIFEFIVYILSVVIISLLIVKFVAVRSVVNGPSMQETLHNGDNLIVEKISFYFREPERFEIVIFDYDSPDEKILVKRIIGLPGETVTVHNGSVYIDGELLEGDVYAKEGYTGGELTVALGEDEYFVLGDNRDHSNDSRSFGAVDRSRICGRVWVRFWPLNQMRSFNHEGE